jgi:sulfite dehydrogenase (cytochrome) subunit A
LKLSLAELKKMPAIELVAVNQCSGNSRGYSDPRVAGGQLANGAVGNSRWRGVPFKAVLDKTGVQQGAKPVTFGGPVSDRTPDFAKALELYHERERLAAFLSPGEFGISMLPTTTAQQRGDSRPSR